MDKAASFIKYIEDSKKAGKKITGIRHFPAVKKKCSAPLSPLDPGIEGFLKAAGTEKLYDHQAKALDLIRGGKNVLISTHTASGKTLVYNIAVFESLLKDPSSKALYVYPAKALARDQLKTAGEFAAGLPGPNLNAGVYDGDTSGPDRLKIKQNPPSILFTNPDMLHSGILAYHGSWNKFFKNLRFIVLDEMHAYRGIFGCHVSGIIRRLRRICSNYGSEPLFIGSSATIDNGAEFSKKLTGLDFSIITESGAPSGDKYFMLWDPGESSPYTDASFLLEKSIENGLKTIVFTKSRKITELIYLWTVQKNPGLKTRISAYRSGYLPEERRRIEKKLFGDELDAVIATSALELGIDVGGLDCCILAGYPGSVISSWQRAGRAGRGDKTSLIIMAALPDALDKYFVKNPNKFFESGFESVIIDEQNPLILSDQLLCAASELPLFPADEKFFGVFSGLAARLASKGEMLLGKDGKTWFASSRYPHRNVSIRSIGENYTIIDAGSSKQMGSISSTRVFSECHPGAVYLHMGLEYDVVSLDLAKRCVYARKTAVDYYTQTTSSETVSIVESLLSKKTGHFLVSTGNVKVDSRVVSWEKRRSSDGVLLGEYKLNLPVQTFETSAVWLELPPEAAKMEALQGGIHAAEHALIALFPLFTMCDRWDIGGVSAVFHPQCSGPVIFMYDACPGGVGLSARAYGQIDKLIKSSFELVSGCPCFEGCPSCIHSPKCGSRNEPLDKRCALKILSGNVFSGAGFSVPGTVKNLPGPARESGCRAEKISPQNKDANILFFDIETQKSAGEVGGWENKRLMRVSVAVSYDEKEAAYEVYNESSINILIDKLFAAGLVVGFNIKNFDMQVLEYYSDRDFSAVKALDILEEVYRALGRRISLQDIASETLGEKKNGSGLDALEWFKNNEIDKLVDYCTKDVHITRELYLFGKKNKFLLFRHKKFGRMRVSVDW